MHQGFAVSPVDPFYYERIPSRNFQVGHSREQTAYLKMTGFVQFNLVAVQVKQYRIMKIMLAFKNF